MGVHPRWLAILVVSCAEVVDALHQLFDAGERTTSNGLVGDQGEEPFNLIEPGSVGRNEMHAPTRSTSQPSLVLRGAVRGVAIDDAVRAQFDGLGLGDFAQGRQEFLMAMPQLAHRQRRPAEDIESGEQRGCRGAGSRA